MFLAFRWSPFGLPGVGFATINASVGSIGRGIYWHIRRPVGVELRIWELWYQCVSVATLVKTFSSMCRIRQFLRHMARNRYSCCCRCGCRRKPGCRRVECDSCGCLVGPGCCLAFEAFASETHQRNFNMCHVCADSYDARCGGIYQHWQLGRMWEAFICALVLLLICPFRFLSRDFRLGD